MPIVFILKKYAKFQIFMKINERWNLWRPFKTFQNSPPLTPAAAPVASEEVNDTKFDSFKTALFGAFEASHAQQLPMEDVKKVVFEKTSLSEGQLMKCIEKMTELNKVMLSSDVLYLI